MENLTVGVLGHRDYAKNIGKKGTSSDITFYNLKSGNRVITAIEPSSYPEKLSSLFHSVSMSDFVVFVVDSFNAEFAEMVIMLDALEKRDGVFITEDRERVAKFVKGTSVENFSFMENDPITLREMLLEMAGKERDTAEDRGAVVIDHFFKVRGVGTVILGIVSSGCVKKHDELTLFPLNKRVQIRSIQEQDIDYERACAGDRVGLALKGVEPEELERGFLLSSVEVKCVNKIKAKIEVNRFYKREIKGDLFLGCGMQFLPSKVKDFKDGNISLELEKPLVLYDRALLCDPSAPKPRIVGKIYGYE